MPERERARGSEKLAHLALSLLSYPTEGQLYKRSWLQEVSASLQKIVVLMQEGINKMSWLRLQIQYCTFGT